MYTSRLKVSDAYVACSKIVSGLIIAGTIWSVFNIHLFRYFFLAVQLCLSTNVPNYMYIYNTHMHARLHTHTGAILSQFKLNGVLFVQPTWKSNSLKRNRFRDSVAVLFDWNIVFMWPFHLFSGFINQKNKNNQLIPVKSCTKHLFQSNLYWRTLECLRRLAHQAHGSCVLFKLTSSYVVFCRMNGINLT